MGWDFRLSAPEKQPRSSFAAVFQARSTASLAKGYFFA